MTEWRVEMSGRWGDCGGAAAKQRRDLSEVKKRATKRLLQPPAAPLPLPRRGSRGQLVALCGFGQPIC